MPVAVHLVEVLALITILGVITSFSILVIAAERSLQISLYLFEPIAFLFSMILSTAEHMLLFIMAKLLAIANILGISCCGCSRN